MENKTQTGVPVNNKSLLAFIMNQMLKLDSGEINADTACAQAKLAAQANNLLDYELKRTVIQIKLREMGVLGKNEIPHIREIESKGFDNTI